MAITVGVHVRDAGVWKRAIPWVRDAGVWKECQKVHVKDAGVWRVAWADPTRALGAINHNISNFDFSAPYATGAGWRMNPDGSVETHDTPPDSLGVFSSDGSWLTFEAGHTFLVSFSDTGSHSLDTVPALSTNLSTSVTRTIESTRTTLGQESGNITVNFFDSLDADPKPSLRSISINLFIENSDFS